MHHKIRREVMGPLAKSLAQNEKGEEHPRDQGQIGAYEDKGLGREQMPCLEEDKGSLKAQSTCFKCFFMLFQNLFP